MVESVHAWHPPVPWVQEVLDATFDHAYPTHTHDSWTVLIVDDGAVTYDLDRTEHRATPAAVTLLPPAVPHDGRSAIEGRRYHKRVLYLDADWLPASSVDGAVKAPTLSDPRIVAAVEGIHAALREPAETMAAECGVLSLADLVREQVGSSDRSAPDAPLARRLRDLLDDRLTESVTIAEAAALLGAHPRHLVRVFTQTYGIAPHHYVIGRRVDRARRLLLDGHHPAQAAAEAGFYDQSHLTRHFRRLLGVTPGAFAA